MAINGVNKVRILKFVRESTLGEFYSGDLYDVLARGSKPTNIDFIEFFTNLSVDSFQKNSSSQKQIAKYISWINYFLENSKINFSKFDPITLGKLQSLREYYETYLSTFSEERNDSLEFYLKKVEELVEKEHSIQKSDESFVVYLNKIEELEKEIKRLNDELSSQVASNKEIQKKMDSRESSFTKGQEKVSKLEGEVRSKTKEIKELEKKVKELLSQIQKYEEEIKDSDERFRLFTEEIERLRNELNQMTRNYESYLELSNELRQQLNEKDESLSNYLAKEEEEKKTIEFRNEEEKKKQFIQDKLLACLCEGSKSIQEMNYYLLKYGISLTVEEFRYHISELRKRVYLSQVSFEKEPSYVIGEPPVLVNQVFDITLGEKNSFDMLLTSDWHIDDRFDENMVNDIQLLHEYCMEHDIHFMLDGGDLFSKFCYKLGDTYHQVTGCESIVRKAISSIPRSDGIYHAVLGGNHDRDFLRMGFDPIERLCCERDDFISLGYDHAKISFNGSRSALSSLGIHHISARFPDAIYATDEIKTAVDSYYSTSGREKPYMDFLGHIHKGALDLVNGIGIIPSYFKDRVCNGAYRVKVLFDSEKNIRQIVFVPVIKQDKKLVETTTISYSKKLVK